MEEEKDELWLLTRYHEGQVVSKSFHRKKRKAKKKAEERIQKTMGWIVTWTKEKSDYFFQGYVVGQKVFELEEIIHQIKDDEEEN